MHAGPFLARARWSRHGLQNRCDRVRSPSVLLTWSWPRGRRTRGGSTRSAGASPEGHAFVHAACAQERCPIEDDDPGGAPPLFDGCRGENPRCGTNTASRSPGGDVGFIRRTRRVRFPRSLPRRSTGCGSTWLERRVRDAETGGSNPLTPTTWRADHLGVIAVLQTARGRFNSDALYHPRVAQWQSTCLISVGPLVRTQPRGRRASSSTVERLPY